MISMHMRFSDPRTWELAAPTIDPTISWLLPRSTAIGWLKEEDAMCSRHLWWGPPAPTFWNHWWELKPIAQKKMCLISEYFKLSGNKSCHHNTVKKFFLNKCVITHVYMIILNCFSTKRWIFISFQILFLHYLYDNISYKQFILYVTRYSHFQCSTIWKVYK